MLYYKSWMCTYNVSKTFLLVIELKLLLIVLSEYFRNSIQQAMFHDRMVQKRDKGDVVL